MLPQHATLAAALGAIPPPPPPGAPPLSPTAGIERLQRAGLAAATVPAAYGGTGLSLTDVVPLLAAATVGLPAAAAAAVAHHLATVAAAAAVTAPATASPPPSPLGGARAVLDATVGWCRHRGRRRGRTRSLAVGHRAGSAE